MLISVPWGVWRGSRVWRRCPGRRRPPHTQSPVVPGWLTSTHRCCLLLGQHCRQKKTTTFHLHLYNHLENIQKLKHVVMQHPYRSNILWHWIYNLQIIKDVSIHLTHFHLKKPKQPYGCICCCTPWFIFRIWQNQCFFVNGIYQSRAHCVIINAEEKKKNKHLTFIKTGGEKCTQQIRDNIYDEYINNVRGKQGTHTLRKSVNISM